MKEANLLRVDFFILKRSSGVVLVSFTNIRQIGSSCFGKGCHTILSVVRQSSPYHTSMQNRGATRAEHGGVSDLLPLEALELLV